MAENNQQDRLKEIVESIERGIQELFESEKYRQYLKTMSRFHRYSVNNTMLIFMQKPDATLVAGFNKWQDQYSACFSVPKSCISVRKPYSEERRARDSERAKAAGISPPRT